MGGGAIDTQRENKTFAINRERIENKTGRITSGKEIAKDQT